MRAIKEITFLKNGILINTPNISDIFEGNVKNFLLVFRSKKNHEFIYRIAAFAKSKTFGATRKCPAQWLIDKYYASPESFKMVLRSCIEDPQRDDESRPFGTKTLFFIYPIIDGIKGELIETKNFRKTFYFDNFIHMERGASSAKSELNFWLGNIDSTILKFEDYRSVQEYGKNWPAWIENAFDTDLLTKGDQHTNFQLYESSGKYYSFSENLFEILPPLPPHEIVGRDEDIKIITERLQKFISVDNQHSKNNHFVIHGLPGVGKTTVSIALAHNIIIRSIFKDGIIWTYLGKTPDLLEHFKCLGTPLESEQLLKARSLESAELILRKLLRKGNHLIIVDDVWDLSDAKPFLRMSTDFPIIFTTRLREIPNQLSLISDNIHKLDILSPHESLSLLQAMVPNIVKEHKSECKELVESLDGLPLAIRVAGHLLRQQFDSGLSISGLIKELNKGKHILEANTPYEIKLLTDESSLTVAALLKRSTNSLKPQTRECFSLLGILPIKPDKLFFSDLVNSWNIDNPEIVIKELIAYGLIEPSPDKETFQIHYLISLLAQSLYKDSDTND